MSANPPVPQRPARSQDSKPPPAPLEVPKIPPRPTRNLERSISRDREAASRSPLNESPFPGKPPHDSLQGLQGSSETSLKRPPSVASLPLIGQEGMEYASLDQVPQVAQPSVAGQHVTPAQVSNVAADLPLHAPRASDAPSASLTKISAVTGGHQKSKDAEQSPVTPSAHGKSRPPSASQNSYNERSASRSSHHYHSEDEHGIPSFGKTVPMYPNAGDVQAPGLPAGSMGPPTGVGFFHGGSRPPTSDGRRRSAQGFHGPPGSYGLHGHGHLAHDKFEKDWYARHPEEVVKEEHALHVPAAYVERPEYAMSSEELNLLVSDNTRPSSGSGAREDVISVPSEAIGYQASEDYVHVPTSTGAVLEKTKSRGSRPPSISHVDSPLRHTFSAQDLHEADKLHVDPPAFRVDKIGGAGYDPPVEDLGSKGGNTAAKGGWIVESGDGTPILASDEIARHPGAEFMQPAVSPAQMLSEDDYFAAHDADNTIYRTKSRGGSRPNSRHGSTDISRLASHDHHDGMHTPLEDIEEYEPLFEDDDKTAQKPLSAAVERIRLDKRRFPSQDIWEDTPTSLQLETTVETPEEAVAREVREINATGASSAFESPEQEQLRKGEVTEGERARIAATAAQAKPKFGAHLHEGRPGLQRFPSQDIWEDTPDSARLETTVGEEQIDQVSPPQVPSRPARANPDAAAVAQPSIPTRPQRAGDRQVPAVSGKPKPQIPQRPSRSPSKDQPTSPEEGANVAKARPSVPARPAGGPSKFAAIKAGFLNDLNSRIGLGLAAPKTKETEEPKETEEEKAPLGDSRRGRARGPARRKPAASPSTGGGWAIAQPWTVWSVSGSGLKDLAVPLRPKPDASGLVASVKELEGLPTASPLARNTAGEALGGLGSAPSSTEHPDAAAMDARAHRESETRREALRAFEAERIGHSGDMPETVPEPYVEEKPVGLSKQPSDRTVVPETTQRSPPPKQPVESSAKETTPTLAGQVDASTTNLIPTSVLVSSAGEVDEDKVPLMPGKATVVGQAPVSPIATHHKSPMDVIMDEEK